MKILFLTDGITPFVTGGMQRHSENLCRALLPLVEQITLVHCVYEGEIPSAENIKDSWGIQGSNLEIHGYRFPSLGNLPGHYIRESKAFSHMVYQDFKSTLKEFDFIYAKGFTGYAFIKKRVEHEVPVGVMLHGFEMFQRAYGIKQWMRFQLLKSIASYCTLNADIVFSYGGRITPLIQKMGVPYSKIIESSGGIDATWLRNEGELVTNKPIRFLFMGRDERRKGLMELYECLGNIPDAFEFHFIGPLWSIQDERFVYLGEIKNKKELIEHIDQCDVLVCPSHSEGMPNVIMEAMARGLAIVATDVGATSLLVDGGNGWLIPPGGIKHLQNAISESLSQDLKYKKDTSLKRISQFSFDRIAKDFLESLKSKIAPITPS